MTCKSQPYWWPF